MGRSVMVKYVVEMTHVAPDRTPITDVAAWREKSNNANIVADGKPNADNLEKHIMAYIASLKIDGCNAHVSTALGYMPIPTRARIINQGTGNAVAEWTAPAFMVI